MEIVYSGYRHFDFRTLVTYRRIIKEEHLRSTHESKELNEILTRWKEEERRWKAFTLRFGDEMICLWEGLFPDSHNAFQMHQITDLVSSIVSKQKMMSCRGRGGSGRGGGGGAGSLIDLI